jgi:DNA-binding transcriptional ArsR family regulator
MLHYYNMSTEKKYDTLFKALGDARRRIMLDMLKEGPRTTGEICARFARLDRCTVMQHLAVLERAGLLIVKREGRTRWNYLDPLPIRELHERWISRYAAPAVDMLAAMKRGIEGSERGAARGATRARVTARRR